MRSTVMLMTGLTLALLTGAAQAQVVGGNAGLSGTVQGVAATGNLNTGITGGSALEHVKVAPSHLKHNVSTKTEKAGDKVAEKATTTKQAVTAPVENAATVAATTSAPAVPAVAATPAAAVTTPAATVTSPAPVAPTATVATTAKVEAKPEVKPEAKSEAKPK